MSASPINWQDGMKASDVTAVQGKYAAANRHCMEGEQSLLRAGRELRIALRTYLKGDKVRFEAACLDLFDRSVTAAYEYVQAADAVEHFADAVKATGVDLKTVGVRTWAKLDRFTGSDEAKADGLEVIALEAKTAKADGRKAFTNVGVADAIKAVRGVGESTGTDDDRKLGRIAGKYRDDLRSEYATFRAVMAEKGERAAFLFAMRTGATWGAASGALTPMAVTSLAGAWATEDAEAARAEAKAKRESEANAAKLAAERAAAQSLKPTPKAKPAAKVTAVAPKTPAPKRGAGSTKRKGGTAALVANAPAVK